MSWIGAIFILCGCTWAGFEVARKITERPKQLRQLKVALQSFEAEIMYGMSPLTEASYKIGSQLPKPISYLFHNFSDYLKKGEADASTAWNRSLEDIWDWTALKEQEKEILQQFGETLGKHERLQQQKHIRLAMIHLEKEEIEARDHQKKYEAMAKSLGFLCGLLFVILFI
ncbi:stage III sporulation protein SpoIIIAB [Alteribacillus sp. HJP-4]|uniref:stage III sporulation protein SpoIIIAB n=1 Tax=Alteribacillus sp. HJP-4 TaxID=2775394 RepID=UPI0035CD1727